MTCSADLPGFPGIQHHQLALIIFVAGWWVGPRGFFKSLSHGIIHLSDLRGLVGGGGHDNSNAAWGR